MDTKAEVKRWLELNLPKALAVENNNYSMLLLLSTIDCFAQAWGGFPKKNVGENFCKFILEHTDNKSLGRVCPITLAYDFGISLHLQQGELLSYNDDRLEKLSQSLVAGLPEDKRDRAKERHQYVRLLYVLRSKLVHELNNPGTPIEFIDNKPTISSGIVDGQRVWTLNYPKQFIYELAKETIANYLDECKEVPMRKISLSWYE